MNSVLQAEILGHGVFDSIADFATANAVELYTAIIATAGVGFWIIDRKSKKAALLAAEGSDANTLRLERQKIEASVDRSYATLQQSCQTARATWERHDLRNGSAFSLGFQPTEERKEIDRISLEGTKLMRRLEASAPPEKCPDIDKLTAYFAAVDRTAIEMGCLTEQLPMPGRLNH